jgi:thioesterase domain-containing protein
VEPVHPFFFVPSGTGSYAYAYTIAKHLDYDGPLYALPWQSPHAKPVTGIPAMAAQMIEIIKTVQQLGPYRLIGYSAGGVLAYAVADLLMKSGDVVACVGLIDVRAPFQFALDWIEPKQLIIHMLAQEASQPMLAALYELQQRAAHFTLPQLAQQAQELGITPPDWNAEEEAMRWQQRSHFLHAVKEYQPPPLATDMYQFHAQNRKSFRVVSRDGRSLSLEEHEMHAIGWDEVLNAKQMHLVRIPGNHTTILTKASHCKVLADKIANAIRP